MVIIVSSLKARACRAACWLVVARGGAGEWGRHGGHGTTAGAMVGLCLFTQLSPRWITTPTYVAYFMYFWLSHVGRPFFIWVPGRLHLSNGTYRQLLAGAQIWVAYAQALARVTMLVVTEKGKEKQNVRPTMAVITQVEGGFLACGYGVSLAKSTVNRFGSNHMVVSAPLARG